MKTPHRRSMEKRARNQVRFLLTLGAILNVVTFTSCMPNIRIQVNNDNYQSPPYLLEAIKQVESATGNNSEAPLQAANEQAQAGEQLAQQGSLINKSQPRVGEPLSRLQSAAGALINNSKPAEEEEYLTTTGHGLVAEEPAASGAAPAEANNFSVVKEETIEEILDLDPESVLKLSPESLMSGISPSDYSRIVDNVASETAPSGDFSTHMESVDGNNNNNNNNNHNKQRETAELLVHRKHQAALDSPTLSVPALPVNSRKPQLPVTNAHLKKPHLSGLLDEKSELVASSENAELANSSVATIGDGGVPMKTGGAKTLVSPSVAAEEEEQQQQQSSASNFKPKKANQQQPPDTWEPSQVMNGVTNASLVPATVNKEYGGQATRTRITLGGGYVRDRLPPLVNPASSDYVDSKPEKPVAPLERPHLEPPTSAVGGEVSRIIEIPERIVLSEGVMKQASEQLPAPALTKNQTQLGKLDSRCPKRGVMTFDHPTACDKYFYCEEGYILEQTCPNGLMYGTRDMVVDYCVHRWRVNCEDKSVPNPISSPGCRWQYGIFNVQGSPKCSPDFYECTAGKFEVKRCSIEGQIYDDRTKSCQYAEQAGCANEALADFKCPPDDQGNTYWPFPRYFLNERALIHCVNDKPEIVRCTNDERVDPEHLHCVPLSKITQSAGSVPALEARKSRERKKSST